MTANDDSHIASYALYWVLSLVDYYRYTGDQTTLQQYISNVQTKLTQAKDMFDHPGIGFYGWDDRLGGFTKYGNHEPREAYRMLFIETCRRFSWAMGAIGHNALREQYLQMARQHAASIQANSNWVRDVGIFAASGAINADVPTAAQEQLLYQHDYTNPVERISLSPFNEYFIIEAMGRRNWTDQALQTVLEDRGGQIKYGGTTFLECYWPSWNTVIAKNDPVPSCLAGLTSLCHAWSTGCTTWLTEYVAGITPTGPGFSAVDITPHPGRLLTQVAANAPTPHGILHASFDFKRGVADIVIPQGVKARIGVPKLQRTITAIRVNDRLAWSGSYQRVTGISGATDDGEWIYFTGVQPGRYTFVTSYSGRTPTCVPQPLVHSVKVVGQDDKTCGNWGGVYGRDGYVLIDYDGGGKPKESLPSYVESVTCHSGRYVRWPNSGDDSRALAPDRSNKGQRIASAHWNWGQSTMAVDIRLKHAHNYRLALYAVDFDRKERQESVDIYCVPSLVLAAPVQVIWHFEKGKYQIFDCHNSVRLRINVVRGPDAVVSGVFFDPPKTA